MTLNIEQYIEGAQELCVLPDIYIKLTDMLRDDTSTLEDMAKVIALEPALSAQLLKIANSALFSFPKEVAEIDRALMIIGVNKLGTLIHAYGVTAAFSEVDPRVIDMDKYWEISVDCALMTKFLADRKGVPNSHSLFLAGLFHNIGALVLVHQAREQVQLCERYSKEQLPWHRQQEVFGFTYADVSAHLLKAWHLPEVITEPIEHFHHAYQTPKDKSSTLLYITSRLALYHSHQGMYNRASILGPHLLEDLNLTSKDIDEALEYCRAQALEIMSALNVI